MLETPLYGRFIGESRRLVFAPSGPYRHLVRACYIFGLAGAGLGLLGTFTDANLPFGDMWWLITGLAVVAAGMLATYSMEALSFDLRERTYRRRQGAGGAASASRGAFGELDAIVLISEPNSRMLRGGITYHLVLHWKAERQPPLVLQQDTRVLPTGQPLNYAAAPLLSTGLNYARALGLPFYDNSHFPSPNPVPLMRSGI